MNKGPKYFILGDLSWPVESLAQVLPRHSDVSVWIEGRGWIEGPPAGKAPRQSVKSRSKVLQPEEVAHSCFERARQDPSRESVVIVGFKSPELSSRVVKELQEGGSPQVKILEVGGRARKSSIHQGQRSVSWTELVSANVDMEIHLLSIQKRVRQLLEHLGDARHIGILLQDDPDPDGLASGLALRKLLNRNAQTVHICSFGRITRPENVAMARLLEIEVEEVKSVDELRTRFDRVVCVDCQPSFFKGREIEVSAIIDHHPKSESTAVLEDSGDVFVEVVDTLGSISTLLTQYLRSADIEISQRLATALIYGIKSDTLLFNRQASGFDLEAFVYLYPRINTQTLRKIERPELPRGYLECLRHGLLDLYLKEGLCVLGLGEVTREEWIPQGADFAAQIEGVEWSFCWGIHEERLVISARSHASRLHCGEIIKALFCKAGCAGGHRAMAKAILEIDAWRKLSRSKTSAIKETTQALARMITKEIKKTSQEQNASL